MRRIGNLLTTIMDMDNLRLAFWKAGKGKRHANAVLAYQSKMEANLRLLQRQLESGNIEVGNYHYFLIHEPKERQICAAAFEEQVLHHALMNICHHYFDRKLIYDTYACLKGKGTYAALTRAQQYTKKYEWFLKLDVRHFFASIHHDVLKKQLAGVFKDRRLLVLFYKIIDSYEATPGQGLPIGNLTSQYFANHHLCDLDYYIKYKLGHKAYVRYMDDMVIWSNDKTELNFFKKRVQEFLQAKLLLELKPCQLNRTRLGLPFLGYRIFPFHIRLLQKSKVRFARKIHRSLHNWQEGIWDDQTAQAHVLPLIAFTQHAASKSLRKVVLYTTEGQTS